jgi:hypothetical protein
MAARPLGPRLVIDDKQMRSEVFDVILNGIKERIIWPYDPPNDQKCKLILSGLLGECPYTIHFLKTELPDYDIMNTGDE